ncbi:Plasmodium exported protein (PHISTa-like), putative [Plasmodium sp.]|nr:Plasmodium exported protein (PHISTa-like), putative [Plasmodium sp.]
MKVYSASSDCSNSEYAVKYNDVTTMEKCNNINYKDLSKQLTLQGLDNVLDNLKESPPNEDLYNIWTYALDYLNKYEYQHYQHFGKREPIGVNNKYSTWYKSMHGIGEKVFSTDIEYTFNFYSLIKNEASIDEKKKFIYSYIK